MIRMKKQSRSPLLNTLRNAFSLAKESKKINSPSIDELIDIQEQQRLNRRKFIGDIFKTGIAVSTAGILNACRGAENVIPPSISNSAAKNKNQPKIVIIGAGMAGLNCAYQLKKAGFSSTIYEASTRIGGRIFTKNNILAPGLHTELGGEFIDSEHKDMIKLCHEFGLPLVDTLSREESKYLRDSFFIDGRFYTEVEIIKAFQPYASRIQADIDSLPDEMTYDNFNEAALRFDKMSIRSYLDSIGMTGVIRKGIEVAYLTEYGLETNIQSAINFLFLFSADTSKGFEIFGTSDERYKIEGGNQKITDQLYDKVKDIVIAEHSLTKIQETYSGYVLHFTRSNGSSLSVNADLVVLAIPFSVLRSVDIKVDLPAWKKNAITNLGYGTNSKLLLGFNKKVWRNYQHSGYIFTDGSIQTGWDNSQLQPEKSGGFTVYQGGEKGMELGTGTPESQAPKFLQQLNRMWPGCEAAFNGSVKRMHWPTYPYTKGSYACYTVGQYTSVRGAEIKPVGNLFFAGEHCSNYFQGFMNGAAETGRIAAENIIKVAKSKGALRAA